MEIIFGFGFDLNLGQHNMLPFIPKEKRHTDKLSRRVHRTNMVPCIPIREHRHTAKFSRISGGAEPPQLGRV